MAETIYGFEIHTDKGQFETSISSVDIIDAIYGVMDIYQEALDTYLTADNFVLIGEQ